MPKAAAVGAEPQRPHLAAREFVDAAKWHPLPATQAQRNPGWRWSMHTRVGAQSEWIGWKLENDFVWALHVPTMQLFRNDMRGSLGGTMNRTKVSKNKATVRRPLHAVMELHSAGSRYLRIEGGYEAHEITTYTTEDQVPKPTIQVVNPKRTRKTITVTEERHVLHLDPYQLREVLEYCGYTLGDNLEWSWQDGKLVGIWSTTTETES